MTYADVRRQDWFWGPVEKAGRMGGMRGFVDQRGAKVFRPGEPVTRAQQAAVYVRGAKAFRYSLLSVRSSVLGIASEAGIGTGSLLTQDGLILTNYHVVRVPLDAGQTAISAPARLASGFRIRLSDRDYLPGEEAWLVAERGPDGRLVDGAYARVHQLPDGRCACPLPGKGTGGYLDLALLKLSDRQLAEARARLGDPLPVIRLLAPPHGPDIAEPVFAFGSPMGRYGWFSGGHVGRPNERNGIVQCIGADLAINPGNSGGPLFTLESLVCGIIAWKLADSSAKVDDMGIAISLAEVLPWLALHGVSPGLEPDIPDEDELAP
jgi:S1-C subfamily serine protease